MCECACARGWPWRALVVFGEGGCGTSVLWSSMKMRGVSCSSLSLSPFLFVRACVYGCVRVCLHAVARAPPRCCGLINKNINVNKET